MKSIAPLGSNGVMVNPCAAVRNKPPGRAYGGLSPEDRVAARRARLVQAGAALFGTQGLRATTVRSVCTEAGLTDRYFYESFASLEALLAAVYVDMMAGLRQRLLALPPWPAQPRGADVDWPAAERRCSAGYQAWFDAVSDPRFARVVLAEVLGVNADIDALYEAHTQDFAAHTAAPLARLRLSAERRTLIGHALVGAAVQVARHWVASGYAAPRWAVVRTCVLVAMGTLRELAGERDED